MAKKPGAKKPADGKPARSGGPLSPEDAELWRTVADQTKPLSPDKHVNIPPSPEPPPETAAKPGVKPAHRAASAEPDTPPLRPAPPPPELRAGAAPGVDKRLAERLKRGQLPIDGTLDLHGMTQAQAHAALNEFVAAGRQAGRRCVLVVTGKGAGSGSDEYGRPREGVLRTAVPKWLNAAPNRSHILVFAQAQPQHGGGGALYVLLKRNR